MIIPLQFASLYDRQIFMWSSCLLDLCTDFLCGNMGPRHPTRKGNVVVLGVVPQSGAAGAEIKVPSGENKSLNVLPLKPGAGRYIAIHATLTARDFFLAYLYPSGPFTCIFS